MRPGAKAIVHADGAIDGWVGGGCVRPVVVQEARRRAGTTAGRGSCGCNVETGSAPRTHGDVREYPMTCQGEGGVEIYLEPVLAAPRLVCSGTRPSRSRSRDSATELGFDVVSDGRTTAAALAGADASTCVVVATMGAGDEAALVPRRRATRAYVGLVASRKKGRSWSTTRARAA